MAERGTWLDRAIGWVAPRRGAERIAWRQTMNSVRGYDLAQSGRRTDGWVSSGTGANAEIGPALALGRARSRDLARNNPHAAKAINVIVANVVGAGIMPRPAEKDEKAKAAIAADWLAFSDQCDPEGRLDWPALEALALRTVVESGAAIIRWYPRPSRSGLRVPLQCRVLEPDFIDVLKNENLANGGQIVQGVEFDADGARVAYWLFDHHPGETMISLRASLTSRRVAAEYVDHVFLTLRPGQVHGMPWLSPVGLALRDIADWSEAELIRKQVASCFSMIVTTQAGPAGSTLAKGNNVTTQTDGNRIEKISPAMIQYLAPGETVEFGEPPGSEGYSDYMREKLHTVAAGIGITYEQLTGDLSQVNYSSMRAGKNEFWALCDLWQWHLLVPQMLNPAWRRVDRIAQAMGRRRQQALPPKWAMPVRPYVNPLDDIDAKVREIRAGLVTWDDAVAAQGLDPQAQLADIVAHNAAVDREKVILSGDPRNVDEAGARQKPAAPEMPSPSPAKRGI